MRLKSFDNYLITFMGMLAIASLYMLYGVKFNGNSDNQIRVASIVEQIKTVKRKRDFYQSWVDVNPGDSLSQNDEIYTHGQSSAKINFINGPSISLFENSLLRIKGLRKDSTLSLDKGNLTATLTKNSPKLDVLLNGKKYSFESQNANIQIEQGATENKFLLLDGKARLNINETAQEIRENQVLIQNKKTGDLKIKELPFILKTPTHNSLNYFSQKADINFVWSYSSLSAPAKIVISRNSAFQDIVYESTISEDHVTYQFDKAGIYYWKLVSIDDVEGPIRTFTLLEEKPLVLNLDKEMIYKGPKKSEAVNISWERDNAKKYLIKIDRPQNETYEQALELETTKNKYELIADRTGAYRISVKVLDQNRPQALWSEAVAIQVLEAKAINITSNTPDSLEKINYSSKPTTHLLSWNGPVSGVTYTVRLTRKKQTEGFSTENTSMPLTLKEAGEYTWEVEGLTESGIGSNIISGKILVKSPLDINQIPSEGAVIELEKPDQLVSFKWEQVQNIREYQFELASDPEFQNMIYEKGVDTNNISTALAKTGRYFWRVKVKSGDAVEYSQPVGVEIRPTPPLSRPDDLPSLKIKLKYLEDKTTMNFNWLDFFISTAAAADPVAVAEWDIPSNSRAKEYIVEIYQDAELTDLITRIVTQRPHVVWKNAMPGIFHWRVSYVDYWGRKTEFSKVSTLSTEMDQVALKALALKEAASVPIEMLTPKHKEDILESEVDEFLFTWSTLPNTKSYQFLIDTELEFQNPLVNVKTNTPEIKIKCKDLKNAEGEYYWKVMTPAGNTSKRRMFHIECEPKEIELTPAEEAQINIEEENKIHHFAKIGIFPHKLSYTNTSAQYSAKVDGNAINSFYALYQRPVEWKYFQIFSPSIWISRGKVFETITFTDFELNFKAGKKEKNFIWGPIIAMIKKTLYVEAGRAITAEGLSSPLLGAFIQKNIGKLSLGAELKFGGMLNYHAEVQYAFKKRVTAGLFFEGASVTKDTSKHSFTALGLNIGYIFPFLESEIK